MSRPPRRRRGRSSLATWLLASAVALLLTTALVLFVTEGDDAAPPAAPAKKAQAEGVLSLPGDDASQKEGRRGAQGRERLDPASAASGDGAASTAVDPTLAPVFANLADVNVALAPASASAPGDGARTVRAGGLKLACSGVIDIDRLSVELALLDRVQRLLERAGAKVTRVDGARGAVGCVDVRTRELEKAAIALVLRAGGADEPRIFAGRAAADLDAGSRARSTSLAAELAGAMKTTSVTPSTSAKIRTLLERSAAIDLRGGAAVAMVEIAHDDDLAADALDALALQLATAIAATSSRADQ